MRFSAKRKINLEISQDFPTSKSIFSPDIYLERTKRNHFWVGGPSGQMKLRNLRVGVAGLGGMGSNIAEMFVRIGVGYLRITDPDIIERSNFNRQVIANEKTLGRKKSIASVEELQAIASDVKVDFSTEGITSANVDQFVSGLDVIINEIDVLHMDKQIALIEAAYRKNICVYTSLVVGLGIHFYKYDPQSNFSPSNFLGDLVKNPSVENLANKLGSPLPSYLGGSKLSSFINEISSSGVPIFGASTYLGQSLLVIRVLKDLGCLELDNIPETPCLPRFLILDPLSFEFAIAEVRDNGEIVKV